MPKPFEHQYAHLKPHIEILKAFRSKPKPLDISDELHDSLNRHVDEAVVVNAMAKIQEWARANPRKIALMSLIEELRVIGFTLSSSMEVIPIERLTMNFSYPEIEHLRKILDKLDIWQIELIALKRQKDELFMRAFRELLKSKGFVLGPRFKVYGLH